MAAANTRCLCTLSPCATLPLPINPTQELLTPEEREVRDRVRRFAVSQAARCAGQEATLFVEVAGGLSGQAWYVCGCGCMYRQQ